MLISRTWLQELLIGPRGTALPDDAALDAAITSLGLEVEGTTRFGEGLETIIVGEVRSLGPHPSADRLRVVEVYDGSALITVVCGAPNVPDVGGKIAFAPVGTTLPGGLTLTEREVRGVASHGMICSEQELEIGLDGDGILVLPMTWPAGERLIDQVPGIVDTVFELGITPNRPDALGHIGVARDLAAKLGFTLVAPPLAEPRVPDEAELVGMQAPERCGRYFGYAFEDAKVGPSPLWLRVRLHRLGLRPINSVVDITNVVLMEWGQPLHAFDRAKLAEGRVVVRTAQEGETLRTLDEQDLTLRAEDLVIADAKSPQALAGVMGGSSSGVTEGTTTLLLEAAWFNPMYVRRTARHHQISSDSSYRFERGVDHGQGLTRAAHRAFGLIEKLTGARCIAGHVVDGERPSLPKIDLRPARTRMLLGMDVPNSEAKAILQGLEVEVDDSDAERWVCRPPTHRPDLQREVDLIEEVMRLHGLEDLPAVPSMPTGYGESAATSLQEPSGVLSRDEHDRLVDAFAAQGLHEAVGFAFAEPDKLTKVQGDDALRHAVHLQNPMRGGGTVLRTHLLPGLLDAATLNVARHGRAVRLFEVGRIYRWATPVTGEGPTAAIDAKLPQEPMRAGVLLVAARGATDPEVVDGHTVAGILLDALDTIGLRAALASADADDPALTHLHPGVRGTLTLGGDPIGSFGAVHPDLLQAWSIPDGVVVVYGEISVDALPNAPTTRFSGLPRFPATSRDLSLDLAVEIPSAAVVAAIEASSAETTVDGDDPPRLSVGDNARDAVEVIEDYRGKGVQDGRRALLLRLGYRAADRSVTDAEVQALHDRIIEGALGRLRARDPAAAPR